MLKLMKSVALLVILTSSVMQCSKSDVNAFLDVLLGNGSTTPHTVGGEIWFVYKAMSIKLSASSTSETLSYSVDPLNNKFQFTKTLMKGSTYDVTINAQPTGETCEVINGKGIIDTINITNIKVYCYVNKDSFEYDNDYTLLTTIYDPDPAGTTNPIGTQNRTIHDVDPSLDSTTNVTTYEDIDFVKIRFTKEGVYTFTVTNVGEDLDPVLAMYSSTLTELKYVDDDIEGFDEFFTITVDGTTFSTATTYYLWIAPYWGSGFYSLNVTLDKSIYLVNATVTGQAGGTLRLQNGSDTLDFTVNATKSFAKKIANAATYAVSVVAQPVGQTCTVTSGSGTIATANASVSVNCIANAGTQFTLGGTVSGLVGSGLVLTNGVASASTKSITSVGWYAFNSTLANGTAYNVSVQTQPSTPKQTCSVTASGSITTNVTTANVSCVTNKYSVAANVSGLTGTLKLYNNGGDLLNITANGISTFATTLNDLLAYNVTVSVQPLGKVCTVSSPSGKLAGANVTLNVSCVAQSACDLVGSFTTAKHNVSLLSSTASSQTREVCITGLVAANVYVIYSNVNTTSGTISGGSGGGVLANAVGKDIAVAKIRPKKNKSAKAKLVKPRRGQIQTNNPVPSYIHDFNTEYSVFKKGGSTFQKPTGSLSKGASGSCACKTGTVNTTACTWNTSESVAGRSTAPATILRGRRTITDQGEVKYICVWVAGADWNTTMNTTKVTTVLNKFAGTLASGTNLNGTSNTNGIYSMNRNILGKEWYNSTYTATLAYGNIIPGQESVDVVYYDIDGNGSWGTLGYFWGLNNIKNSGNSNQALVFFMDSATFGEDSNGGGWNPGPGAGADRGPVKMLGTLAHEFQHMIHYYQYGILQKNSSKTWVNEMASLTIEDSLATKIGGTGTGPLMGSYSRLWKYFKAPNCNVTIWGEGTPSECSVYQSYGTSAAFGGFLARNYGGPDFLKNLLKSAVNDSLGSGMQRVQDAIQTAPVSSSDTWQTAFAKWGASTVMNPAKSLLVVNYAATTQSGYGYFSKTFGVYTYQQTSVFASRNPRMYATPPSTIKPYSHVIWKAKSNYSGSLNFSFTQPPNVEVSVVVSPN